MEIKQVAFAGSYPKESLCPKDGKPEYAFIGRSNVGKSSLINMLVERKNLAHTSGKPGKTQLINYYLVNGEWYLVDLPGYGYAKISKSKRREWQQMIRTYLNHRMALQCTFSLIDANIPPQEKDLEFINGLGEEHVPFVIAYTKTDRMKPETMDQNIEAIQRALLAYWNELPQQFITSADKRIGRAEILEFIESVNKSYFARM